MDSLLEQEGWERRVFESLSKEKDALDDKHEEEWIKAVENAMAAALKATQQVAELWPDVGQLIQESGRNAGHPEARALYDTIKESQDCVVAETRQALDSAQRAIEAFKQADFEPLAKAHPRQLLLATRCLIQER